MAQSCDLTDINETRGTVLSAQSILKRTVSWGAQRLRMGNVAKTAILAT
ncbi:MAG: hypothetical protein LBN10_00615 [Propionibacteriaceae bacterium]|nr:hypothetical protein [Propionibacteriaceae bacterium]